MSATSARGGAELLSRNVTRILPGTVPKESVPLSTEGVIGAVVVLAAIVLWVLGRGRPALSGRSRGEPLPPATPWIQERPGVIVISDEWRDRLRAQAEILGHTVLARLERGTRTRPRLYLTLVSPGLLHAGPFEIAEPGPAGTDLEPRFMAGDPELDRRFLLAGDPRAPSEVGKDALLEDSLVRLRWDGRETLDAVYTLPSFDDPEANHAALSHLLAIASRPPEGYRG